MREALRQNETEKAISYFSDSTKDAYRKVFTSLPPEKRAQFVRDLGNIQFVRETGLSAEYDLRRTRDGKVYSYPLRFEKGSDGTWKIKAF